MRTAIKYLAPWLAAAAIAGAVALAPIAGAVSNPTGPNGSDPDPTVPFGEDPSVPYGTLPMSPYIYGYHTWDDVHSPYDIKNGVPF